MKFQKLIIFIVLAFQFGCQNNQSIKEMTIPCKYGGEPNLHVTDQGKAFLSWVEYVNDTTDVLAFSTLEDKVWSAPNIIAKGSNWFVNWADFPSITAYEDNNQHLAAHWLQKSAKGTYDYDIRIAQSTNGGKNWKPSFIPHTDGIAAEHGFVTLLPVKGQKIFATWLDGRYTKTENNSDGHDHEGQGGAMTLRGAFFDIQGSLSGEIELDEKVCDCCSTTAALTKNGVIVAYRDRSDEEVRDISIVRQIGNDWTRPRTVSNDHWEIAGCPVNGPKIVADGGDRVAIVWYTMAKDSARVKLAISNDAGANFAPAITIDDGNPLGRVDVVFAGKEVIVSWLEHKSVEKAVIRLAKVQEDGKISQKMTLTEVSPARSSGFPIMERYKDQLLMAWTELLDEAENTTVRSALVEW